jgi:hypothetical protein
MRQYFYTSLLVAVLLPLVSSAEDLNAGFVRGLWYGSETVVASEPTRIYVALRNNTDHDLTGTVRFSDNGSRIGVSYVNALPGRLVEAWVDWTPSYGEHSITATLSDVRIYEIGQAPETGDVEDTIAQDTIFVDYDTDNDGVLNQKDEDDDNDMVSDVDEVKRGTDPLKANPIPKKEDDAKDTNSETKNDTTDKETIGELPRNTASAKEPEGLEQYVPNPTVHDALSSVTDTINDTRASLDTYRQKRTDAIIEYFDEPSASTSLEDRVSTIIDEGATITRSHIDQKDSFITSVIEGMKALVRGFYSLILWISSNALAHPALLELVLLIFLIYMVYRTARKFGRRRNNQ